MKKGFVLLLSFTCVFSIASISFAMAKIDGAVLFEKKCLGCHSPTWLKSIVQSPEQWEATVTSMMMSAGVRLTKKEKSLVITWLSFPT